MSRNSDDALLELLDGCEHDDASMCYACCEAELREAGITDEQLHLMADNCRRFVAQQSELHERGQWARGLL